MISYKLISHSKPLGPMVKKILRLFDDIRKSDEQSAMTTISFFLNDDNIFDNL